MTDSIEQYLNKKVKGIARQAIDNARLVQSMYSEIEKEGRLSPTDLKLCLHQYTLFIKLDLLLEVYKDNFYNQATTKDRASYELIYEHVQKLLKTDGKAFVDIICQMCQDNNTFTNSILEITDELKNISEEETE